MYKLNPVKSGCFEIRKQSNFTKLYTIDPAAKPVRSWSTVLLLDTVEMQTLISTQIHFSFPRMLITFISLPEQISLRETTYFNIPS